MFVLFYPEVSLRFWLLWPMVRHTVRVRAPEPCDCKLWPGARNISSFAKRGLCSELWGSAVQLEIHDNRITSNIAIVEVYTSSKKWVEILSERSILIFSYTKECSWSLKHKWGDRWLFPTFIYLHSNSESTPAYKTRLEQRKIQLNVHCC